MNARTTIAALAALAVIGACSSDSRTPTDPSSGSTVELHRKHKEKHEQKHDRAAALRNIPVSGALADGGTFTGTLSITNIAAEAGQLRASGVLRGVATPVGGTATQIVQRFADIPMTLGQPAGAAVMAAAPQQVDASCAILGLDLGPLHLDLLGLVVDLNEVILDLTAQPGPGNLLGNLLCAVTHLLDLPGAFIAVQNLLNIVNSLLSGI